MNCVGIATNGVVTGAMAPHKYSVQSSAKKPLLDFILESLRRAGCRVIFSSEPNEAPFRITFETMDGEQMGIIAYAFLANQKLTKNRPSDEHRFQVKYGSKDGREHEIWQDPYGLYTTVFLGINPEQGFFVGADPVLHNPTKLFISVEFKQQYVDEILDKGWFAWERDRRMGDDNPVEVLVGGRAESFLRFVRFERDALGEEPGHRQLLAERLEKIVIPKKVPLGAAILNVPSPRRLHELAAEFQLSEHEVLDLIESAPRLKMAVRGWVAEEHLYRTIKAVKGVQSCERLEVEGGADITLRYKDKPVTIECKNVLRKTNAAGLVRLDFQRTRASKSDPCSRYYSPDDFDIVAACLHAITEKWEFRYVLSRNLDPHNRCTAKLSNNVRIDERWTDLPQKVLLEAVQ